MATEEVVVTSEEELFRSWNTNCGELVKDAKLLDGITMQSA